LIWLSTLQGSATLLLLLDELVQKAEDNSCSIILSGSSILPWMLFSVQQWNTKTKYSIITQSIIFETDAFINIEDLKDYERLLRHYHNIDKHELREVKRQFSSINCSQLSQLYTYLGIQDANQICTEFKQKIMQQSTYQISQLSTGKHDQVISLLLQYTSESAIPLKGKLAKYLVTTKESQFCIKDSYLLNAMKEYVKNTPHIENKN